MLVRLTCKGLLPNTEHTVKHATYIKAKQSKWPLNISFLHMHSFLFFTFIVQRNKQEKQTCNRKVKYFAAAGLTLKKIYIYYPPPPPQKNTHTQKKTQKKNTPTNKNQQTNQASMYPVSQWNEVKQTSQWGSILSDPSKMCTPYGAPSHLLNE